MENLGIKIELDRDNIITEQAMKLLTDYYCRDKEPSPQYAFARAATCYSPNNEFAQKIYDYVSKGWFMFASPVLSNAILPGEKVKA